MIPECSQNDPAAGDDGALLAALRRTLSAAGWTQTRIAKELHVGTATVKRWLHGRGLSFHTLGRLCAMADTSLAELAEASRLAAQQQNHLTLAQEEALTRDSNLSTVFFLIVNGWPPSEATEAFHIPSDEVESHVIRLERLALIDRSSGGRLRARLNPAHAWQRTPMRRHFERHLKPLFFTMDYGDPDAIYGAETVKLSPLGLARLRDRIEAFRGEIRALEAEDRRTSSLPADWFAVLAVARSMRPMIKP
jgi:transcriptional regulator with XRE-family HTH domain